MLQLPVTTDCHISLNNHQSSNKCFVSNKLRISTGTWLFTRHTSICGPKSIGNNNNKYKYINITITCLSKWTEEILPSAHGEPWRFHHGTKIFYHLIDLCVTLKHLFERLLFSDFNFPLLLLLSNCLVNCFPNVKACSRKLREICSLLIEICWV